MTAKVRFADVAVGEELKPWRYRVTREDLLAYAGASGDQNPIHQDEAFAKQVGLPDVISHGMLTMAKIGQYVTDWAGDPAAVVRLKTRFTQMVIVPKDTGNEVTVSGKVTSKGDGNRVVLELAAAVGDVNVGAAEAEVELA
ncbi:MAG: MaoC/PaaZ C-terminal domain-containing protein [Actinomycetota bacterium]